LIESKIEEEEEKRRSSVGDFREGVSQARDTGSFPLLNSHEICIRMALYEDKEFRNNAEIHLQPLDPRSSA